MLAVMFGVVTACLGVMLLGVAGMAMRAVGVVGVVGGLLMVTGLMVLGGLAMMLGGVFMMFGGLVVMLDGVFAHISLPVWWLRVWLIYANHLTLWRQGKDRFVAVRFRTLGCECQFIARPR